MAELAEAITRLRQGYGGSPRHFGRSAVAASALAKSAHPRDSARGILAKVSRMCAQQIILGETIDFLTGETIVDTLDERARQKIARFLVEEKGYSQDEIEVRQQIVLTVDGNRGSSKVDFVIRVVGKAFMIVIFGPGSLVSRERSTVAAARLVEDYEVPFAVVTNGEGAQVIETSSGKVIAEGLDNIPSKPEALRKLETITFEKLSEERIEKEKRILYTFDVLAKCECDEFVCNR